MWYNRIIFHPCYSDAIGVDTIAVCEQWARTCVSLVYEYEFEQLFFVLFSFFAIFCRYCSGKQQQCYSILINIFDSRWEFYFFQTRSNSSLTWFVEFSLLCSEKIITAKMSLRNLISASISSDDTKWIWLLEVLNKIPNVLDKVHGICAFEIRWLCLWLVQCVNVTHREIKRARVLVTVCALMSTQFQFKCIFRLSNS